MRMGDGIKLAVRLTNKQTGMTAVTGRAIGWRGWLRVLFGATRHLLEIEAD
jgi:hypothetical protein